MFKAVPAQFDFPAAERDVLAFWEKQRIYEKSLERRRGGPPFIFYEGPPTANGMPHPGHCLTRAIKDLFPRYRTMCGYYCERKAGWDTHGLPVEVEVCKELGIHSKEEIEAYGVEPFIHKCMESVFRYTKEWETLTKRLGFWVNLEEAYVTYHQSYVESVWWALKTLFEAGLLYQGHKIVWWWAQGGTALSSGEVGQGYREVNDPSVYVRFPLVVDDQFRRFVAKHELALPGGTGVPPVLGGTGVPPVPVSNTHPPVSEQTRAVSEALRIRSRYLPHWEAGGSTYFVTFRTRHGELSHEERTIVQKACLHFHQQRVAVHAMVVMPDHIHLLMTPLKKQADTWWSLSELMHSIKSFSAKEIQRRRGGAGPVWMEEYFDRIIRNESDFDEKLQYIMHNPLKRGLAEDYSWLWEERMTPAREQPDGRDARTTHNQDTASAIPEASRISLLVWTTTPWTLISNTFAAVHPELEYAIVYDEKSREVLIVAAELRETIAKKVKADSWTLVRRMKGTDLLGLRYQPPYGVYANRPAQDFIRDAGPGLLYEARVPLRNGGEECPCWRVLPAGFVTIESGTGLVHEAPAFGEVDFELLQDERDRFANPESIPLLCAVAPDGTFTDDAPPQYRGRWVKDCDKEIIRDLKERGLLLHHELYRHDYPFCWRAEDDPLIQYPRKSWFIRTTQFRDDMLANNAAINWLPEHIKEGRFGDFLRNNVDWALSRERYWGTPLPIWVCEKTGHMEAVASWDELMSKPDVQGVEVWEAARRKNPALSQHLKVHKPYIDEINYRSPKDPTARMKRVPDVIDCWFDSGAMPFAQWGYPHADRQRFESNFPCDFLSEALDQTRGWFYSLVAISTLLFGRNGVAANRNQDTPPTAEQSLLYSNWPQPFRNCIVLGLLMGEDGLKMSKSKKNYKEPSYIFDHEGADAMRWLFFSGQAPWTSIRFQESAIADGQREFLIRLYNVYSFFVIYANIDRWTAPPFGDARLPESLGELDRWILSELHGAIRDVRAAMDAYDNFSAARRLNEFVDALSNWYVRRSRERFWRGGMDADKQAAYAVLYDCLVTTTLLIAPFTPFLAETLYQNLVVAGAARGDAPLPESVHLCDYPTPDPARIDEKLSEEMAVVRGVVSLGRAARAEAKIRVRQPLPLVEIVLADPAHTAWLAAHESLFCDELNVKAVEFTAHADHYVNYQVKPNFKSLGPRFGKLAPAIKAALAAVADPAAMRRQLEERGRASLTVDGQTIELTPEDVKVELSAKPGWTAAQDRTAVVVLRTEISDELRREGLARELVHHVQQIRKNLDLRYEQRIELGITGNAELQEVVRAFESYLAGETLAERLTIAPIAGITAHRVDIEGHAAELFVKPL